MARTSDTRRDVDGIDLTLRSLQWSGDSFIGVQSNSEGTRSSAAGFRYGLSGQGEANRSLVDKPSSHHRDRGPRRRVR